MIPETVADEARPDPDADGGFCTSCGRRLVGQRCPAGHDAARRPALDAPHAGPRKGVAVLALLTAAALVVCAVLWRGQMGLDDELERTRGRMEAQADDLRRARSDLRALRDDTARELDAVRQALPEVPDIARVAEEVQPSVFTVETDTGQGSGWVVSAASGRSTLITNFHVVAGAWTNGRRDVAVLKEDGTYEGTILEVDEAADLAVVEVSVALRPLERATAAPAVGDGVLALGSPLGLEGTVSSGIVSAFRTEGGVDYLQFSAPISPGNSGGPVVDTEGRVVGVSVAKYVAEGAEGLSFAIPVREVCVQLDVC